MSMFNDKNKIGKDWLSVEREGRTFKCFDRGDNGWMIPIPELGRTEHPRESSVTMSSTYEFPGMHQSES